MLTYLRYALATICFAVSVGCMGLWWRSTSHQDSLHGSTSNQSQVILIGCYDGFVDVALFDLQPQRSNSQLITSWRAETEEITEPNNFASHRIAQSGFFGQTVRGFYFPIWFPALIFAVAAVAAIRVSRFTLRSAIIATTVVAGLLGMAVIL